MSRQLRLEYPGALWHVTSRGNERRNIVRDDLDRRRFVRFLGRVVEDQGWLLHAWVLMTNHYHLLLETPQANLSSGVQWLNQRYAETFNQRHGRVGHLFQGRFKGVLVEREGHLLELVRYVVLNPVRCGAVSSAAEYPWSSYRATAGLAAAPRWLEVRWTLQRFGNVTEQGPFEEYRQFVASATGSYKPWQQLRGEIYLGGDDFTERVQQMINERVRSAQHPLAQRRVVVPAIDEVARLVAERFQIVTEDLKEKSRGPARKALAWMATEAGISLTSISRWMAVTVPAVSKMRDRARILRDGDERFRRQLAEIDGVLKLNS